MKYEKSIYPYSFHICVILFRALLDCGLLFKKTMNIYQTIPRIDCKAFAKCGVKSLSHCRRHRLDDPECSACKLIFRKPRNRWRDASGLEMKRCTRCGKYFYLNRFYKRVVTRKGKKYNLWTSWCRMCTSKVNLERAKKKTKNE